jgi:predicted nucleic acid-binding protein
LIYLDSSALVKRYIVEKGTETLQSMMAGAGELVTSKLTYAEIWSAFMRKFREGGLKKKSLDAAAERFEMDWDHFFVIDFHDELPAIIKKLVKRHPLKAVDAVHLSSAMWLEEEIQANLTFIASDYGLLKAAEAEHLRVGNPLDLE